MFRVTTLSGTELGVTETVNYIRINKHNGCFNACAKQDAIGIAFKSSPYNLIGHSEIKDAETVIISEVDVGTEVEVLRRNNAMLLEQLAESDEAAIELYETSINQEIVNAEQDEAIIKIYEMIGEITNG